MTRQRRRFEKAAEQLEKAIHATGEIHVTDMDTESLKQLKDSREDMRGWVRSFGSWAEEVEEREE